MSLWNPYTFTVLGAPVFGTPPAALRVLGPPPTTEQLSMAQQVYVEFCMQIRLSVVPNPSQQGRLRDSTPYRIFVVGPQATMTLQTADGNAAAVAVAYPVYYDLEYMPVFDRHVINDPDPGMPQPPTIPPEPVFVPTTVIYQPNLKARVAFDGLILVDTDLYIGLYRDTLTNEITEVPPPLPLSAALANLSNAIAAENASRDAHNVTEMAAYSASVAARAAEFAEWQTSVYFPWMEERDRLLAEYADAYQAWLDSKTAYPGMESLRRAGRAVQASATAAFINGGIGHPHLTARLLSFPYNVGFQHAESFPPSPGDVFATVDSEDGDTVATYVLSLTGPQAVVTDPVAANVEVRARSPFPLRDDIASPLRLFGWMASGAITRARRYVAEHSAEPMQALTSGVSFDALPGYAEFSTSALAPNPGKTLVISSGRFVPLGTRLTIVNLEYECFDAFLDEWAWYPHPQMTDVDAVWKVDLGHHFDPKPDVTPQPPRAVRSRGSIVQARSSFGWSTGAGPTVSWARTLAAPLPHYPAALVVVDLLPAVAIPIPDGETVFPFGQRASDVRTVGSLSGRLDAAWSGVAT